jgi:hypothetical protein
MVPGLPEAPAQHGREQDDAGEPRDPIDASNRRRRFARYGAGCGAAALERDTAYRDPEMSPQNIPLKGRTDFRESSRIPATETIRV